MTLQCIRIARMFGRAVCGGSGRSSFASPEQSPNPTGRPLWELCWYPGTGVLTPIPSNEYVGNFRSRSAEHIDGQLVPHGARTLGVVHHLPREL